MDCRLLRVALFGPVLLAQAGAPALEPTSVSLADALGHADRLAEVRAALAGQKVAAANTRVAGQWGDPDLSFATHSVTARESLSLVWPIPWQRSARLGVAQHEENVATAETGVARADARRDLRAAWFILAVAQERRRVVGDQLERALRNARAVGELYGAGRVAQVDLKRSQAEAAIAAADDAGAEEERRGAAAALALLMDLTPGAPLVAAVPLPQPGEPPTPSTIGERAHELSASVVVAGARWRAAEARQQLAGRLRWPGLGLELGADFNDPTQPGTDKRVGLVVSVPFSGGAASAAATADHDRQALLLELERRRAVGTADSAASAARTARTRYLALDAQALPAATEAAELTRLSHREGRSDLFRLLDAERTLAQVELDRLEAYRAWALAEADLRRIVGDWEP